MKRYCVEQGFGSCSEYKLRDWVFSRQRYWGGDPAGLLRTCAGSDPGGQLPLELPHWRAMS